jgi:hypothetical protein
MAAKVRTSDAQLLVDEEQTWKRPAPFVQFQIVTDEMKQYGSMPIIFALDMTGQLWWKHLSKLDSSWATYRDRHDTHDWNVRSLRYRREFNARIREALRIDSDRAKRKTSK